MDRKETGAGDNFWWKRHDDEGEMSCATPPKPGDRCPACGAANLEYDGLFILTCPACQHVAESGVFS